VEFIHRRMAGLKVYQQFFGCEVVINQEFDRLVLDQALLQRPVVPPDGQTVAKIDDYIANLLSHCAENLELQGSHPTVAEPRHSAALVGARRELNGSAQTDLAAPLAGRKTAVQKLAARGENQHRLLASGGVIDGYYPAVRVAWLRRCCRVFQSLRLRQQMSPAQWRIHRAGVQ
jgi:hypothetical protein